MRTYWPAVAAFGLVGATVPAQAIDPPQILAPSSPWVVNYAEDSCRLIRTFGGDDKQVRLEFRMFAPQNSFWLLVSGKPIGTPPLGTTKIASRFLPDDKDTPITALSGKLDQASPAIMFRASFDTRDMREALAKEYRTDHEAYRRDVRGIDAARETQVNGLEIRLESGARITLRLGAMHAPMEAVRACLDNLLQSWGVDPKTQKSLMHEPVPVIDPGNWLKSSDYPQKMLEQGYNDSVNFRLTVDATGKPVACSVLTMESRPEFIAATCDKLMKRASFKPALDAQGKPVASIYVSTVIWTLS